MGVPHWPGDFGGVHGVGNKGGDVVEALVVGSNTKTTELGAGERCVS